MEGDRKSFKYLPLKLTIQSLQLIFFSLSILQVFSSQCYHCVPLSSCANNKFCRCWLLRFRYKRIVFWSLVDTIFKNEVVNFLKYHHWKFVFFLRKLNTFSYILLLKMLTIPCKQYFLYQIWILPNCSHTSNFKRL